MTAACEKGAACDCAATMGEATFACVHFTGEGPAPTLRDQFAMAALSGVILDAGGSTSATIGTIAAIAYRVADAMMKARQA